MPLRLLPGSAHSEAARRRRLAVPCNQMPDDMRTQREADLLAKLEAELKFSGEQADKSRGEHNQYWRGRLHGAHKALDTARRLVPEPKKPKTP